MSNLSRKIITAAIVILFVAIAAIYTIYNSKSVIIPDGYIGATAGNLNNMGYFCESDGVVYFSNPYDSGTLYSMRPDQTDIKRVYNLKAKYINAAGGYVFFYGEPVATGSGIGNVVAKNGMYMVRNDGEKLKALTKDVCQTMLLVGSKIYYQHYTKSAGTTFAVIDIKKHSSSELLDYMINPASYHDGNFYFNGMYKDHHLYTYNTATSAVTDLWGGDIWNPICDGDYVYYMDVQNNYRLCRYSISRNEIEIITGDRIDFFNVYGDMIYYQKSSKNAPAVKRCKTDGSENEVVYDGVCNSICITSTYVYFKEYDTDSPIYCTPTFGPVSVREFMPLNSIGSSK